MMKYAKDIKENVQKREDMKSNIDKYIKYNKTKLDELF